MNKELKKSFSLMTSVARVAGILGIISLMLPWTLTVETLTFPYLGKEQYFVLKWLSGFVFLIIKKDESLAIVPSTITILFPRYWFARDWLMWVTSIINDIALVLVLIGSVLLIRGKLPKVGSFLLLFGALATLAWSIRLPSQTYIPIPVGSFLALIAGIAGLRAPVTVLKKVVGIPSDEKVIYRLGNFYSGKSNLYRQSSIP
jgi:hypothetical protein